mgnify:CR=1 FL=1
MTRSAAIAAAYMLALSQGGPMRGGQPHYVPTASQPRQFDSQDAERIAKASAKRARKAAMRAKREGAKE